MFRKGERKRERERERKREKERETQMRDIHICINVNSYHMCVTES